jgi:hypothetical protein
MSHPNKDEASWPSNLVDLERLLADRIRQEPAPDLRQRVQAAVSRELDRQAGERTKRLRWRRLGAAAAVVLVWINFSTSLVNNMDWRFRGDNGGAEMAAAARHVRKLAPDLSEQDAMRQALLLQAGSRAAPAPYIRASLDRFLKNQLREHESWDTR